MQVLGVRLQCSRLRSVDPQGQPRCVLADQISALCPDFFLQIQLSLFNPQFKKINKNANQKAGKALCCSCLPRVPRQTGTGSGGESRSTWVPRENNQPVHVQDPSPEHLPLPQRKESLVIGDHMAHATACWVEWPLVPCGYMASGFFPSCIKVCPTSICPVQGVVSVWHEKSLELMSPLGSSVHIQSSVGCPWPLGAE